MKKHPLILFELLIALSLVTVLLTLFFRFIANSAKIQTKIEEARAFLYPREHLHRRLSSLFTALVPRSFMKSSSFYTLEDGGIAAIFDNGIDPDPALSGLIRSRLTVEHEALYLTLFPLEEERPQRKELLLSDVKSIRFQFLAKKDPLYRNEMQNGEFDKKAPHNFCSERETIADRQGSIENKIGIKPSPCAYPISRTAEWRTSWSKEHWDLPSLIRMTLEQEGGELCFSFALPFPEPAIIYGAPK